VERINRGEEPPSDEAEPGLDMKRKIFEKVRRKMIELGLEKSNCDSPFGCQKSPDVIITSSDQVLLLEPQNWRVTQWLHERCGLRMDNIEACDKIPVHPCQRSRVIADLKAAGFEVVC
jgi:hypothetical protein